MPTNGVNSFVDTGNSGTEGFPDLNPNGTNLVLAGYNAALGATTASATAAATPRAVATVDGSGNFNIVATSTTAFSSGNIRTATTDGGTNYWAAGSVMGIGYMGTGPTNVTCVPANSVNNRVIRQIGGNIYFSTGSSTHGIYQITGDPINTGNAASIVINVSSLSSSTSPYGFSFSPSMNLCYIADSTTFTTSAGYSGIEKWTNNAGTWTFLYSIAPGTGNGCDDVAVDWSNPTQPTIYATIANGSALVKVQDTGSGVVATTNAIAAPNTAFRGLAWAPTNTSTVMAPTLFGISPASQTLGSGSTATFTLSGTTGSPIASNNWYKVVAGVSTNLIVSQHGAALVLSNIQNPSDTASYFAILTNASGSVTSAVVSLTVQDAAPYNISILPASFTNGAGSAASFTVTASGTTPFSYYWYKEVPGTSTNFIPNATTATLSFPSTVLSDTASYQVVVSNSIAPYVATSSVVTLVVTSAPPVITGIGPANVTTNAGQRVSFTVTNSGSGPFTYLWYKETASATNLISGATNATLTLLGVLHGDAVNYQVIITNTAGSATSAVVSLTVTGDPAIETQPASAYGLLHGVAQFAVGVAATAPAYQWYFTDPSGNIIAPASNGTQGSGSVISGATSSTLMITNLQLIDPTNFVVAVTNIYGAVTSSVASLLSVANSAELAFWDFNGPEFTNTAINPNCINDPVSHIGAGIASAAGSCFTPGTSPFSGSVDPNDGQGFTTHLPPFSWGTSAYPASGGNKQNGAQFNISTVGAKNIRFSYESRATGTASKYERLQYTTNGTDWVDYPSSSTFSSTTVSWYPFSYDLTGFPGVANNPNFGVRVVTEIQSTATYGVSSNTNYVGTANTYGTAGTLTYDLVTFTGDAITSANQPPVVGGFMNTNMVDYIPLTNNFTVSDDSTAPDALQYSAVSLNTSTFNPTFEFQGSGVNRILIIHPNSIAQSVAAAPILVTVTDANGDSTKAWFDVTVGTINLPPANTLAQLSMTNMLANTNLVIPFTVSDDRTPTNGHSFSVTATSGNTTLIPNDTVKNIILNNITPNTNYTFTIIPATNQVGVGVVSVTVNDNDPDAQKSTTATIPIMVRPNTNVVMIDYFNYDTPGALDAESGGFWQHLTGNVGQMQVSGGVVTVDTLNNTENLVTPLLGAPYATNSGTVLYASIVVNMDQALQGNMPRNNGTYFACFQNGYTVAQVGSGATSYVEGLLVAATNDAAPGYYRLGIANVNGATALTAQMFPMDLSPSSNYVVVVSLALSNGFSTLWINPTNSSSQSVMDTTPATNPTNLYSIQDFELRSSGANAGVISVSRLLVGKTFNSVIYPPVANPDAYSVAENSSGNVLNPLQNDSGTGLSLVSVSPTSGSVISGNQLLYTPPVNFTGTTNISYTVMDNIGGTNSSTIAVTVVPPSTIVPTVPPGITGFSLSGNNVVITGTNAQATGVYYLLSSTNVAWPLNQWIPVATNVVGTNGANGSFSFTGTNVVLPGSTKQFYILSNTNNQ